MRTPMQVMASTIISQEPLMSDSSKPLLRQLLRRLVDKQLEAQPSQYDLLKVCRTHA